MENGLKYKISEELSRLADKRSLNSLSHRTGVSAATLSHMINGKWKLIRDEMWRKVMITLKIDFNWVTAETANLKGMVELLESAQARSFSLAISYNAGSGKSHAYRHYERTHANVVHIECKKYWSKKSYVRNLLVSAGINPEGTTEEMIERFLEHLRGLESPILIIDQADKLKDPSLDLFMDFYNDLDGYCSFILSGVPALEIRLMRGKQRDKSGYAEYWSRIGRRTIRLNPVSIKDVRMICEANGVKDEQEISEIFNTCEGDLRRVKKSVERYFLMREKAVAKVEN
ncbi:MAG: ATP-binding protein [Bacteroidales bacterium]|nr:ATP-binding protein [Bacteroidales bacterium]